MLKQMKNSCIFFLLLCYINCNSQTWQWAKLAGGDDECYGTGILTDRKGNIFVAGSFESSNLNFGSIVLTNIDLNIGIPPPYVEDVFLAKYDTSGNIIWAKRDGGKGGEYCFGIAKDFNDNIYLTGGFDSDTAVFGSFKLVNSYISGGSEDIFLAKYDSNGNIIWAKNFGGKNFEAGQSVSTDLSGNIYVSGWFGDTVQFGSTTLIGQAPGGIYGQSAFLIKCDSNGTVLWAKQSDMDPKAGNFSAVSTSVTTDLNENVLITGYFYSDTITFSGLRLINSDTSFSRDIFVVKYDTNGNIIWAKKSGGKQEDYAQGITIDEKNNVLLTGGSSSDTAYFGNYLIENKANVNSYTNAFIAKYDTSGNAIWVKESLGKGYTCGNGISSTNNNIYITGYFTTDTLLFDSHFITDDTLGRNNAFVAKYNSDGIALWALNSKGKEQIGNAIYSFPNDSSVYITGYFLNDTSTFGNKLLIDTNSNHNQDVFVAKISSRSTDTSTIKMNTLELPLPLSCSSIYPNPFITETKILADKKFTDATLTLYDILGQEIKTMKNISAESIQLERENLQSGIYILYLQEDSIKMTCKIIITN
jgi:hypothetical protein